MDSFEWDLCSSILSLEEFDFTPIPESTPGIGNAWFCSLDSCILGANRDESENGVDQFPCLGNGDYNHMSMYGGVNEEEKKMESILSACSDIFLQEINGFSNENLLNMEVETHQGDNVGNFVNELHHKRKFIGVLDGDDDETKVNNPIKKIRSSNNVQRTRKAKQSNYSKAKQKMSNNLQGKCEEELVENGGPEMNSCSNIDNLSEDDNASQDTTTTNNNNNNNGDTIDLPAKSKTRATRGSATDPQSIYARKRRERINERLNILQTLVPNGTKVDISTMLEEAVHYVKFLQLQIKLLSSDELWMYGPIAYNGMDIGLQLKLSSIL